jgi:hypothetical protein
MSYLLPGLITMLLLSAFMFAFMQKAVFSKLRERTENGRYGRRNGME